MKNVKYALAIFLSSFAVVAVQAQIILDDFTSNANAVNWRGYDSNTGGRDLEYNAAGSILTTFKDLTIGARTGGFWWTGGEQLYPGDTISVDIRLGVKGLAAGLRFGTSTFGKNLTAIDRDTSGAGTIEDGAGSPYIGTYWINISQSATDDKFRVDAGTSANGRGAIGGTELSSDLPTVSDTFTLIVSRGQGVSQNLLTYSFAGDFFTGESGSVTFTGLQENEGLYFALNQAVNSNPGTQFSNFTYTAIPEPAHYTALIGLLVMGLIFFRRGRA